LIVTSSPGVLTDFRHSVSNISRVTSVDDGINLTTRAEADDHRRPRHYSPPPRPTARHQRPRPGADRVAPVHRPGFRADHRRPDSDRGRGEPAHLLPVLRLQA